MVGDSGAAHQKQPIRKVRHFDIADPLLSLVGTQREACVRRCQGPLRTSLYGQRRHGFARVPYPCFSSDRSKRQILRSPVF